MGDANSKPTEEPTAPHAQSSILDTFFKGQSECRFKRGDHIRRPIRDSTLHHHGICVSQNDVISFYNESQIIKETIKEFSQGENIELVYRPSEDELEEIASRAEAYLNSQDFGTYNVVLNNCEHFASVCLKGEAHKSSQQVQRVARTTAIGAVTGGIAAGPIGAIMGAAEAFRKDVKGE